MRKFLDVVRNSVEATEAARVNCASCPVNMACMVGEGGNGWTFDCCHSTAFQLGEHLLVIDCGKHSFEQKEEAKKVKQCPLCSGEIMESDERDRRMSRGAARMRYLPTVHALVPIETRIETWRPALEKAVIRCDAEAAVRGTRR